jgi:hypothetical protein
MRSRALAAAVVAVMVLTAGDALAVGSMQRPPVIDLGVIAPISHQLPPNIFTSEMLQGCGSHRHYDPETQTCRGPADF